ncbi:Uncharacterized protein SAPIO_CDS3895 [Scedosporium apiospermum]|uniref:Autophagy-related protein 18 n=1 Tax=Pseudallescheria apiosperma TaxID=563466 RepID=A0A084G8U2_PSEDA|nr:Uncharacterized protein SAPIO_CDS3895 [Scedosporium apiospermum]KEZ43754.1 Uncharacterized protein SAPIO_CDS3895 [Scedosporium apiospermum]
MSFNPTSTLLCVSSVSDTVHIFRLANATTSSSSSAALHAVSGALESSTSSRNDRWSRPRSHDGSGDSPTGSAAGSPVSDAADIPAPTSGRGGSSGGATRRQSGSFSSILRRSSQIMGRSVAGVVGSYLPQTVTEMWEPQRDFAYIKLPKSSASSSTHSRATTSTTQPAPTGPLRSVVAMRSNSPEVMVITSDGGFYVFEIDMETGGEGRLTMKFSVLDGDDKLDTLSYGS